MPYYLHSPGSFSKTMDWLLGLSRSQTKVLEKYGQIGVDALAAATPKDTGETAAGWRYRLASSPGGAMLEWYNVHAPYGEPVALLIQLGHGTGTGGYVQGIDYINPAMRPIFDKIEQEIMKEVGR